MKPKSVAEPSKSPNAKTKDAPDSKDDLKTLPLAEVEKRLESSLGRPHGSRSVKAAHERWAQ